MADNHIIVTKEEAAFLKKLMLNCPEARSTQDWYKLYDKVLEADEYHQEMEKRCKKYPGLKCPHSEKDPLPCDVCLIAADPMDMPNHSLRGS